MRSILAFLAVAALSSAAFAQQPAANQDHLAHHPDGASGPAASAKKPPGAQAARPKAPPAAASGGMGMGMGGNMGQMHDRPHKQDMHDRMHGKDGKDGKDGKMMNGGSMPASSAGK